MITKTQKPIKDPQKKRRNPKITVKKNSKPQGKKPRKKERNRAELQKQPKTNE